MWNNIDKDEYLKMKSSGLNDKEIYWELRTNKHSKGSEISEVSKLDIELKKSIKLFKHFITSNPVFTYKTKEEIKELINILNRIMLHIELKE